MKPRREPPSMVGLLVLRLLMAVALGMVIWSVVGRYIKVKI